MVVVGAMFAGVGLRYQLYINHTQPYTEKKRERKTLVLSIGIPMNLGGRHLWCMCDVGVLREKKKHMSYSIR